MDAASTAQFFDVFGVDDLELEAEFFEHLDALQATRRIATRVPPVCGRSWRPGSWRWSPRAASGRATSASGGADDSPSRRVPLPTPPRRRPLVHGAAGTAPVIDVQTHFLETPSIGGGFPQAQCGEANPGDCFAVDYWYDLVLGGSDTSVAVISAVPVVGEPDPLSIEAMERGRAPRVAAVRRRAGAHPGPRRPQPRSARRRARRRWPTSPRPTRSCAWKVYTHSPQGLFLDDHDPAAPQIGGPFLDAVRASGVPILAVHKGFGGDPPSPFASPVDIGPAAAANPDISFLVYHSGYEGLDTVEAELRDRTDRASTGWSTASPRPASLRVATSTPSSARHGGRSWAARTRRHTCSASC